MSEGKEGYEPSEEDAESHMTEKEKGMSEGRADVISNISAAHVSVEKRKAKLEKVEKHEQMRVEFDNDLDDSLKNLQQESANVKLDDEEIMDLKQKMIDAIMLNYGPDYFVPLSSPTIKDEEVGGGISKLGRRIELWVQDRGKGSGGERMYLDVLYPDKKPVNAPEIRDNPLAKSRYLQE